MTETRRVLTSYPVRVVGALVLLFGGVWVINHASAAPRPAATAAPAASTPAPGQITSGVWLVGADVQPGTYRSPGPASGDSYCMWSRHSSLAGGLMDAIIASDGGETGHQMVVTIAASDKLFRTTCAPFTKVN